MAAQNATTFDYATKDDMNPVWDPEDSTFINAVVRAGIATIAVGVAVLVGFLIYYCVRCVCWVCLGDECCDKRNKTRASEGTVKCNNLFITALLVITIGSGIWLLYAGSPIINSLNKLTDTLVEEATVFKDEAVETIAIIERAVPPEPDGTPALQLTELRKVKDLLTESEKTLVTAEDNVRYATERFHGVIIVIGIASIACAVLGILCVFVRSIVFLYLYFILATITVFCCWSMGGFALIGNRAFVETCDMMELQLQGKPNQFVMENLPCQELKNAGSAISEAQEAANVAIQNSNKELTDVNAQAQTAQAIPGVASPDAVPYEPLPPICEPYDEIPPGSKNFEPKKNSTGCTAFDRASLEAEYSDRVCLKDLPPGAGSENPDLQNCVINENRPIPREIYNNLLNTSDALADLNGKMDFIKNVTECGFLDAAYEHITADNCPPLERDSQKLATAALIAAIALTITSFYFCICIQNIRKQDAPVPQFTQGNVEQHPAKAS